MPPKERARAYHERFHRLSEDAARRGEQDSIPSSKQWPASRASRAPLPDVGERAARLPAPVTALQWSQRAEQAANDEVHEREQQSGASSAGTKSAMLAEKLLLTEGVAIRAPFRLPEEAHLETRLRLPLGEDEERRPQGAGRYSCGLCTCPGWDSNPHGPKALAF